MTVKAVLFMPNVEYIPFSLIDRFRDEKRRITDFEKEPKRSSGGEWSGPDGSALSYIPVEGGWHRIYISGKNNIFWLMEIEGPDHGVRFYGPYPGADLPGERKS